MEKKKQKFVLIRGLPGTGKSTLARTMEGFVVCEANAFFYKTGSYRFDGRLLSASHIQCQEDVRWALENGENVVVANTFTELWEMDVYIKMGQEFSCEIEIIEQKVFFKNIHNVPDETMRRMRNKWEALPEDYLTTKVL